jgi:hypothetical protein
MQQYRRVAKQKSAAKCKGVDDLTGGIRNSFLFHSILGRAAAQALSEEVINFGNKKEGSSEVRIQRFP